MKKPFHMIVTLLFLMHINCVKANDSLSYSYQKISIGIHLPLFNIRPHITYNLGRHQFGAGLVIRRPTQYYWYVYPTGSLYTLGENQKGISINGANLFYRFYPLKPKESFTFCFENYVGFTHNRLDYNGAFYQRNFRLSGAIQIHGRYNFLERYAVFLGIGPTLHWKFAKDNEGIYQSFPQFKKYPRLSLYPNLVLGFEFGIN